jgi:hypothetical protein
MAVVNLTFSQSSYPIQKVIDGDTFVILRKSQADTINAIFESQKRKISDSKVLLFSKDSIIKRKDSIISSIGRYYFDYITLKEEYIDIKTFLTYVENWITNRAKGGSYIYYSYDSNWIEAVDLSNHNLVKDDLTGDLFFYKIIEGSTDNRDSKKKEKDNYPKRNWEKEIVIPNRPKIYKL